MAKRHKVVLRFEDLHGDRMDLFLQEKSDGVKVFARHTRRKVISEGATTTHKSLKAAEKALSDLAEAIRAKGWEARLPKKHKDEPSTMSIDPVSGDRVFKDRDGNVIKDESASAPPKVKMPDTTPPPKPKKEKEPEFLELPKPH